MNPDYVEYQARKIVNIHKHVDGPWFWGKYTAHPYVGCRSGCEFCYCRGTRYAGKRAPESFDALIQIKTNAAELLQKEIASLPRDVISVGDWQQPAESRYALSRRMLEVVRDWSFPLFLVERSPLVARDLDLLIDINRRAWVGVLFSISTLDPELKRAFEPKSPGVKARLRAMASLAKRGILVGTSLMPVLPFASDDETRLEEVVRATKDNGGSCVLAGGLTMDGIQALRTLEAAKHISPELEVKWRGLYAWRPGNQPAYGPKREYSAQLGLRVRELCARHGLGDRMPRYVAPGPLAVNKCIAERLFLLTYDLELKGACDFRIWAYRKAAWAVDESPVSVAEVYGDRGQPGLQELPGVGRSLAGHIASLIPEELARAQLILPKRA